MRVVFGLTVTWVLLDAHGLARVVALSAASGYVFLVVAGLMWRRDREQRRGIEPMPRAGGR